MRRNGTNRLSGLVAVLTVSLCSPLGARAAEVTLVAPGGIRSAIEQLIPGFEQKTGHKVKATFGSGLGTKQQVIRGDAFDVPIIQLPYDEVVRSGNVVEKSVRTLASVPVGIAVRQGAAKPDISSPEAVKRTLLSAKSISYPDPSGGAAAGVSFEAALRKLGIFDQLQSKLKKARGGAVAMEMAAKGEAEIGVTFTSEMDVPGVDIVGPLPASVSSPTTLVGFISTKSKDSAVAKALLDYISAPEAAAAYRAHQMQPGH